MNLAPAAMSLASLPIGANRAYFGTHVRELEMRARALFPQVRSLTPVGDDEYFPHLSSFISLGGITLAAVSHLPCRLEIGEGRTSTLVIPHAGRGQWSAGNRHIAATAGKSALLLSPAGGCGVTEGATSGLYLSIDEKQLRQVGCAMSGGRPVDFALDDARELDLKLSDTVSLLAGLEILLGQISSAMDNPELVPMLRLDDLFHRFAALLLAPARFLGSPPRRRGKPSLREVDLICDRIRALPHVPVNLSEMEAHSGYSRAALIESFRSRFGCTPIQWVRRERLARAFDEIRDCGDAQRVDAIVQRLGFTSRRNFDRLFQHHFGLAPLEVLAAEPHRMH